MQTGNIQLQTLSTIKDSSGSAGTSGQVLSSTSTGTAWINASSGGSLKTIQTHDIGACNSYVQGNGASSSNWAFNGTMFTPAINTNISTSSKMSTFLVQNGGGNFIFCIYNLIIGGSYTLVAYTASTSISVTGFTTPITFSTVSTSTLTAGTYYYIGMWYSSNAPSILGTATANNTNIKPYIGVGYYNQGTISTSPPPVITESSTAETGKMYFKLDV